MKKNRLVVAAAVLTFTIGSPTNVSARGFGGAHGGGSAGHYSGSHQGSYNGNHYSGSHSGSTSGGAYNGSHEGSFNGGAANGYHPDAAAYGAAAYGAAASNNSGYYSAIPSDEGFSQVVAPQTYGTPTTGPVIIGGYPDGLGGVGGWGGNVPAVRAANGGFDGDGLRGGGGFRGRGR